MRIFEPIGISVYPGDMRALSPDELQKRYIAQISGMQNATLTSGTYALMHQAHIPAPPPQRPLNERFAEFKVRLAAAIERRRGY